MITLLGRASIKRQYVRLFRQYCGSTIKENDVLAIKSCKGLRNSRLPEYVPSPFSKLYNAIWREPLENVFVVKKPWNESVTNAMLAFMRHVHDEYPGVNLIVTEEVANELVNETSLTGIETNVEDSTRVSSTSDPVTLSNTSQITLFTGSVDDIADKTDLIVTLGGDGTILRAVSTFSNSSVPPVLSFALGTLGFLLPFDFTKAADTFRMVYESRGKALHRSRLECYVVKKSQFTEPDYSVKERLLQQERNSQIQNSSMVYAMNDVVLHRGSQPNLTALDVYIDGTLLTTTTADGLVFSTPTGSTAYSLSAGGAIAHPLVRCILLTPICPRSLSFRPLILPSTSHVMMKMSENNRNLSIKLSIDGIPQPDLNPGDEIHVVSETGTIYTPGSHPHLALAKKRKNPKKEGEAPHTKSGFQEGIWCMARSETDWTSDINELLGFNSSFGKKKV